MTSSGNASRPEKMSVLATAVVGGTTSAVEPGGRGRAAGGMVVGSLTRPVVVAVEAIDVDVDVGVDVDDVEEEGTGRAGVSGRCGVEEGASPE